MASTEQTSSTPDIATGSGACYPETELDGQMGGREGEGTGDREVCVEDGEKKKNPKRPDREM